MFAKGAFKCFLPNFLFLILVHEGFCSKRPIFIIGNQINSIEEVIPFLSAGANALHSDVQFHKDGSIKQLHHGCPGDCDRVCEEKVGIVEYLQHLNSITNPQVDGSYYDQLILQFFDLKLENSKDLERSGRTIAQVILDNLWTDERRPRQIKVLLDIDDIENSDAIRGFMQEFKDREQGHRLKDVGFDGGMHQNFTTAAIMFKEFEISNVWMGDGIPDCHNEDYTHTRLQKEIKNRDSPRGFIKKVYDWTVDTQERMKTSLDLGVDSFVTNVPNHLVKVLKLEGYVDRFRIATIGDNPFERYEKDEY